MGDIFLDKTATEALGKFNCALGLDVSRRSTGVCLYQNGVLVLYQISTEAKYSTEDRLWEANMKRQFKDDLKKIVKDKTFDLVVIENCINGCNAITNKELTLLNSVFDDLVAEKVCSVKKGRMYRVFPNVWRKQLKQLRNVSGVKDVKELVEKILRSLGFAYVLEHEDDSAYAKKQNGYYDMCDATGMLLAYMHKLSNVSEKEPSSEEETSENNENS